MRRSIVITKATTPAVVDDESVGLTGVAGALSAGSVAVSGAAWNLPATISVHQDGVVGLRQYALNAGAHTISVSGLPTGVTYNSGLEQLEGASTGTGSATATFTLTLGATAVVDTATVSLVEVGSTLVHGELFTISASGFGTRPNCNIDGHSWNGHLHLHYRYCDFATAWPASGSPESAYISALNGFTLSALPPATYGVSRETGGPSQSGFFYQKTGTQRADFLGALKTTTPSGGVFSTQNGIVSFKYAATEGATGKAYRHYDKSNNNNWYLDNDKITGENGAGSWWFPPGVDDIDVGGLDNWKNIKIVTTAENGILYCDGVTYVTVPSLMQNMDYSAKELSAPNSPDSGVTMRFADVMIDPSLARVEVDDGNLQEVQIITSWSDNEIICAFNKGRLASGLSTVRVFNTSGQVVYTGTMGVT